MTTDLVKAVSDIADYFSQTGDDQWEFDANTRHHLSAKLREAAAALSGQAVRWCTISYAHMPHDTCDGTAAPASQSWVSALQLAQSFHETYERLAPYFGYVTRPETRNFNPDSQNGKLMIAVCQELIDALPPAPGGGEK